MRYFVTILIILVLGIGAFLLFGDRQANTPDTATSTDQTEQTDSATSTDDSYVGADNPEVIGTSAGGYEINAYHFGSGDEELVFLSGIHGGYSWNTALLGHRLVDWLENNQNAIPSNLRVTVIPVLNPDGLEEVTGTVTGDFTEADVSSNTTPGRFNANGVDINRNFDCNWQAEGRWQSRTVDAGSSAFSEPESKAFRDYVNQNNPTAVVAYFSAAGGVYSSSCNSGVSSETTTLMNTYAEASNYPAEGEFNAYEITGDVVDWVAKQGIAGISVLLETHNQVEWQKNRGGIEAVLNQYGQ